MPKPQPKPDYWFFLSYTRRDAQGTNNQVNPMFDIFRNELALKVAQRAALPSEVRPEEVGFYDRVDVQPGEDWPETLLRSLQSSRTLVCLYTSAFFKSEECGKEFQLFSDRVNLAPAGAAPRIIPVLWDRPDRFVEVIPQNLGSIQFSNALWGELYSKHGALWLLLQKKDAEYQTFMDALVDAIFKAAKNNDLPPHPAPQAHDQIGSAFHTPAPPVPAGTIPSARGINSAWFVYLAGSKPDYQNVRSDNCYGYDSATWQPFLPHVNDPVGIIAARVAINQGLIPSPITTSPGLNQKLLDEIRRAQDDNTVVVLLVDPWAVKVKSLRQLLVDYDSIKLSNCGLVAIWNPVDPETIQHEPSIKKLLQGVLATSYVQKDVVFQPDAASDQDLREKLKKVIEEVRARILARGRLLRGDPDDASFPKLPVPSGPPPHA